MGRCLQGLCNYLLPLHSFLIYSLTKLSDSFGEASCFEKKKKKHPSTFTTQASNYVLFKKTDKGPSPPAQPPQPTPIRPHFIFILIESYEKQTRM